MRLRKVYQLPMPTEENNNDGFQVSKHTLPQKRRKHKSMAISFFSDPKDPEAPAPKNADAMRRLLFRERLLSSLSSRPWLTHEGDQLSKALQDQLTKEAFRRLYTERTRNLTDIEKLKVYKELNAEILEAGLSELWRMQEFKTDWGAISKRLQSRGVHRDGRSCFTHFIQALDPALGRGRFTKQEDMSLLQQSTRHLGFHWETIALECGSSRTPWRCFCRYQQHLNPKLMRSSWTRNEDVHLHRLVGQVGDITPPSIIVARASGTCFANRTPGQVSDRYVNRIACNLRRGVWTPLEVKRLKLAVRIYGRGQWKEVGNHLPGRSLNSIINRYENVDLPDLKRLPHVLPAQRKPTALPWSAEEDDALVSAMQKYGAGNWCVTRRVLPGRTAAECWRRFHQLNPNKTADMYDALLSIKRKILPASIGHMKGSKRGPKRRRSELAASDFHIQFIEVPAVQNVETKLVEDEHRKKRFFSCYTMLTTEDSNLYCSLMRVHLRRRQQTRNAKDSAMAAGAGIGNLSADSTVVDQVYGAVSSSELMPESSRIGSLSEEKEDRQWKMAVSDDVTLATLIEWTRQKDDLDDGAHSGFIGHGGTPETFSKQTENAREKNL